MSDGDLTWAICESPIGPLTLTAGPSGIRSLDFPGRPRRLAEDARRPMSEAVGQLDAYFAGERQTFELDLEIRGSALRRRVWELLLEVPYGATTSYGELAGRIDESLYPADLEPYLRPRLVGSVLGGNPLPIVVPCHRVIGADGSLTGFGGGLERKRALLDLESGTTQPSLLAGSFGLQD